MAYPEKRPLADKYYNCQILDLSTASVAHIAIAAPSTLVDAYVTLSAAITNASDVITFKKGSTSLGTITIAAADSAIGSVHRIVLTGTEAARTFSSGQALVVDNGGESDTTSIGRVTIVMREL
jgi:hypothetical protein